MNRLMKKIDLFCYKHPGFGIPRLMVYVVIGNLIVWLLGSMDRTNTLYNLFLFSPYHLFKGEVWRIFTFVFVSGQRGFWLLLFLYLYYWIGTSLEAEWGHGRFTIFYLSGMLLTIVYGIIAYFAAGGAEAAAKNGIMYFTADYINLSLFFAFATLFPDMELLLFFIIPVKIKWLALLDAAFFLASAAMQLIAGRWLMSLLPFIAILNFLVFCFDDLRALLAPHLKRRPRKTVDFKREAKKYRKEQAGKPYGKRCDVCGRTDADYPDLEFRYCSKCEGIHCFCIDHINSHIHFKESDK